MKTALSLSAIIALLSLANLFAVAASEIRDGRIELFQEIGNTKSDLRQQFTLARQELIQQFAIARKDTGQQLARAVTLGDQRIGQGLTIADSRAKEATGSIAGLRQDLQPVLKQASSLEIDAQESLDDLYPDLKAATESATVAITSTAQASESIRDATPKLIATAEQIEQDAHGIGQEVHGVAADVHREADEFVKPKKWYQKAFGPVFDLIRIAAVFL